MLVNDFVAVCSKLCRGAEVFIVSKLEIDDLEIEKIGEIDSENEAFDLERDEKVKEERGKLYDISALPGSTKILGMVLTYVILAILYVVLGVMVFGQNLFVTCIVLLLATGIAVLLEKSELFWDIVVAVVLAGSGFALGVPVYMAVTAVLYLAASGVIYFAEKVKRGYEE